MKKQLVITADGSQTLFVPELNEHYHSVHGAIQESYHVFLNEGFHKSANNPMKIFEVGLGTGLNALLTYIESYKNHIKVEYTALEPFPIDPDVVGQLNYSQQIDFGEIESIFSRLHQSGWGKVQKIGEYFDFLKINARLQDIDLPSAYFNLVYFDAFAPAVQPELWTREIFAKLFHASAVHGVVVTYSAKGEIRRFLQDAGFLVERVPGPPGKREMLRGIKVLQG